MAGEIFSALGQLANPQQILGTIQTANNLKLQQMNIEQAEYRRRVVRPIEEQLLRDEQALSGIRTREAKEKQQSAEEARQALVNRFAEDKEATKWLSEHGLPTNYEGFSKYNSLVHAPRVKTAQTIASVEEAIGYSSDEKYRMSAQKSLANIKALHKAGEYEAANQEAVELLRKDPSVQQSEEVKYRQSMLIERTEGLRNQAMGSYYDIMAEQNPTRQAEMTIGLASWLAEAERNNEFFDAPEEVKNLIGNIGAGRSEAVDAYLEAQQNRQLNQVDRLIATGDFSSAEQLLNTIEFSGGVSNTTYEKKLGKIRDTAEAIKAEKDTITTLVSLLEKEEDLGSIVDQKSAVKFMQDRDDVYGSFLGGSAEQIAETADKLVTAAKELDIKSLVGDNTMRLNTNKGIKNPSKAYVGARAYAGGDVSTKTKQNGVGLVSVNTNTYDLTKMNVAPGGVMSYESQDNRTTLVAIPGPNDSEQLIEVPLVIDEATGARVPQFDARAPRGTKLDTLVPAAPDKQKTLRMVDDLTRVLSLEVEHRQTSGRGGVGRELSPESKEIRDFATDMLNRLKPLLAKSKVKTSRGTRESSEVESLDNVTIRGLYRASLATIFKIDRMRAKYPDLKLFE